MLPDVPYQQLQEVMHGVSQCANIIKHGRDTTHSVRTQIQKLLHVNKYGQSDVWNRVL